MNTQTHDSSRHHNCKRSTGCILPFTRNTKFVWAVIGCQRTAGPPDSFVLRSRSRLVIGKCYEIHKRIISIPNKEEFTEEWKWSINAAINNKSDKTDCSNCRGI